MAAKIIDMNRSVSSKNDNDDWPVLKIILLVILLLILMLCSIYLLHRTGYAGSGNTLPASAQVKYG